jgi:copper oxidase (laccase) domain-containing protein
MHESAGAPAAPARLLAAIGPCISRFHFEVGDEVATEFGRQDLASAIHAASGSKPRIDLQAAVKLQLERAGVTAIDTHELCTFRDQAEFFSHRRDHGLTGRMAAVIQPV